MYQDQGNHENQQSQSGNFSWVCPKCHTINNAEICCCCGYKRKIKRRKNPWKIVSIILILLLVLFLGIFSGGGSESDDTAKPTAASDKVSVESKGSACKNGHNFAAATCIKPKTCRDCGETEGEALGHDYLPATCATAARCSRCLKTDGAALAHDWQEATYDAPETCSMCGETRGEVKGFYSELPGDYTSKQVTVGGTNTHPWVFEDEVINCVEFTMHIQIGTVKYGKVYGDFRVYCKNSKGKWENIGTVNVPDQEEVVKTFQFDDPISFTQIAVVAPYRSNYSYSKYLWFENWYLRN